MIIGAGGHGAVVSEAATMMGRWGEILFLDDVLATGMEVVGYPVVGCSAQISEFVRDDTELVVAIGNNRRRVELLENVGRVGGRCATVIHPSAYVSRTAAMSEGVVICAGSVVNTRTEIRRGCIVNTSATIDHDCVLGTGVHVSPGANLAGSVVVEDLVWIGLGATVKSGVTIGTAAIVGASAAVIADVKPDETVVGVPARQVTDS